jgi:Family of unknown function (DUF6186)
MAELRSSERDRKAPLMGLVGWGLVIGLLFAYQGFCLAKGSDRWPAFSEILNTILRNPVGRVLLFGIWLWAGWHLFIRGWRFFLRG